jgi:hypothetical protein
MRPASQNFNAVVEVAFCALTLSERRCHLGASGVLNAHEGDTNRTS